MNYQERGTTDCWLWMLAEEDAPNVKSKMACNNPLCCNPRHVVQSDNVVEIKPNPTEALQKRAEDMGIKVDKRWSIDTLKDKISEAR